MAHLRPLCPLVLIWVAASAVASADLQRLILQSSGNFINLTNGETYSVSSPTPLVVEGQVLLAGNPIEAGGPKEAPPTVDLSSAGAPVFELRNQSSLELRAVLLRMRLDLSSITGKNPFEVRNVPILRVHMGTSPGWLGNLVVKAMHVRSSPYMRDA